MAYLSSEGDDSLYDEHYTTRPFLLVGNVHLTGKKQPTTYFHTLVHAIKGYLDIGILETGAAMMHSGVVFGPILMVLLAFIQLHCQHLLVRACVTITRKEPVKVFPTMSETVQYTLEDGGIQCLKHHSKLFGTFTDVLIFFAQYRYCVKHLLFLATNLAEIGHYYGWDQNYRVFLAMILIPIWLFTFLQNLKSLTPLSFMANVLLLIGCGKILVYSIRHSSASDGLPLMADSVKIPLFFHIILYEFQLTPLVIPIRMEMRDPQLMTSRYGVLNVALVISLTLYVVVGIYAFWEWGDDTKKYAFLNLPKDVTAETIKIFICIGVMFSYPLRMYIVFVVIYPKFHAKWGPFRKPVLIMNTYKTVAVLLTYFVANISANLAPLFDIIVSVTGPILNILLPALLDLVMFYGQLTYPIIIKDTLLMVLAISGTIIGPLRYFHTLISGREEK